MGFPDQLIREQEIEAAAKQAVEAQTSSLIESLMSDLRIALINNQAEQARILLRRINIERRKSGQPDLTNDDMWK